METDEVYHVLFLMFFFGVIGLAYYPNIVRAIVPWIALLGAFYLVFGLLCRATSFTIGIGHSRRDDWLNGFLILVVLGLCLGFPGLAVHSVQSMLGLFASALKWLFV
ncbi:hypothetical protein K8R43_02725 [archaeon]|nr:hypothetical protein [archaeon]